jgi:Swt1-like HEPN
MIEQGLLLEPPPPRAVYQGASILDEFDMEARIKAKRMGRIYELLFCLENSMRELIERTLKEASALADWTNGIDPKLLVSAHKREEQDQEARWHGPRGESILNYLDFPDLGQIILDRWDDFQDLLGDRRWVERYFGEMNPTRRALAHTGDLTDFDVERMEMRVREWQRVVG